MRIERYVLARNLEDAQHQAVHGRFTPGTGAQKPTGPFANGLHLFQVQVDIECVDVRTVKG